MPKKSIQTTAWDSSNKRSACTRPARVVPGIEMDGTRDDLNWVMVRKVW